MPNHKSTIGITIVELLVVIVVIGLLAALTIVSYNGVQDRSATASALTSAQEVQNKATLYTANEGNGAYPTSSQLINVPASSRTSLSVATEAALAGPNPSATVPTGLSYVNCGVTGAKIGYWDSTVDAVRYLAAGSANPINTAATC